jgi:hypothetical protein
MSRNDRGNEKRLTSLRESNGCEEFGAGDHINWTTRPLPNCQCKWTISTGPLGHSRTVSASGPYQLDHSVTPELSVQVDHINWTTQPLPNCQCKWTISTGPFGHSRTVSASRLWHLDHWATRELAVHITFPQPVYTSTVLYIFKEGVTVNLHIYHANCSLVLNFKHKN